MSEDSGTKFSLDGREVYARPGETVLSVAKRHGIEIPALCHHDAVSPSGACRLCLVEVAWGKRSKLVTSCIYMPWEGDTILTNSERVRQARRMVIELLLARCPDVEILRDLAEEYGVGAPRFPTPAHEKKKEDERCIQCGLCVRVCSEVVGQCAIGFENRGTERVISTPFGKQADECVGCGACVFVCPTGALHYEDVDGERIMKEFSTRVPLVRCRVCGNFFATEKQVAAVRDKLNLPQELAETCPRCRGVEFRELLDKCLTFRTSQLRQALTKRRKYHV